MLTERAIDRASRQQLLQLARAGLRTFVLYQQFYRPRLADLPRALQEPASSFVTLYNQSDLRGCIGSTHARYSLAVDVVRNAAAATRDPRFPPVLPREVDEIRLEVSVLSPSRPLTYENYEDLLGKLRPGVDGVIINWNERHALLLPQVWERLPQPAQFLQVLCDKAHIPQQVLWAVPPEIAVLTFEAHSFREDDEDTISE
jgi:AmmeMemoRadiSam system protein A